MVDVIFYSIGWCLFCVCVKCLLVGKNVRVYEIDVDWEFDVCWEMMVCSGCCMVLQIWIGDCYVGGCDEFFVLEWVGELDVLFVG